MDASEDRYPVRRPAEPAMLLPAHALSARSPEPVPWEGLHEDTDGDFLHLIMAGAERLVVGSAGTRP